jgi:SAM-dependent methyltransferase
MNPRFLLLAAHLPASGLLAGASVSRPEQACHAKATSTLCQIHAAAPFPVPSPGVLDVHRDLLDDRRRTNAYRDAIRAVVTPGSVVLDLGSGSGILALFALEAGARRVFAVEQQHSADIAAFLARHLGVSDRMEVIHRRSTAVTLPEPVDVIITETLGSFGLEEGILGSVIDARKRLLKAGGAIIPSALTLSVVPVELPDAYDKHLASWTRQPYGLDFSPMAFFAANSIYVWDVPAAAHLATPEPIIRIDLTTAEDAAAAGRAAFTIGRPAVMHGFAGWFNARLAAGVELTVELTNALPGLTENWQQVYLPIEVPVAVSAGERVTIAVECVDGKKWRWWGEIGGTNFDQLTALAMPPCGYDEGATSS